MDKRLADLAVGTSDEHILAIAKHFFAAGFGLEEEAEKMLMSWVPSDRQVANARNALGSAEKMWTFLGFSDAETGAKQYLGQFAALALLHCGPNLLNAKLLVTVRASLDVFFTTSWGPAKTVNCHCGQRFLRDYSPQLCTTQEGLPTSIARADKRLASVFFLILRHTEYGKAVASVFRILRLPSSFSCVLSFLWCELRKYFKPPAGGIKHRAAWGDEKSRLKLATACAKKGIVIANWCDVGALSSNFIT